MTYGKLQHDSKTRLEHMTVEERLHEKERIHKYYLANKERIKRQTKERRKYISDVLKKEKEKEECRIVKTMIKKHPELLDDKSKRIINDICRRYLLSDII